MQQKIANGVLPVWYKNFSGRRGQTNVVVGKQGKKKGGWGEGIFACLLPAPRNGGWNTALEKGSCAKEGVMLKSPFSEPLKVIWIFSEKSSDFV